MIEVKALAVKQGNYSDGRKKYTAAYALPDGDIVTENTELHCAAGSILVLAPYKIYSKNDSYINGRCGLKIVQIK